MIFIYDSFFSFLQGPRDIKIFTDPSERMNTPYPDDVLKEAQNAQLDIIDLLSKVQPTSRAKFVSN